MQKKFDQSLPKKNTKTLGLAMIFIFSFLLFFPLAGEANPSPFYQKTSERSKERHILVTGCARSGTSYTTYLLNLCALKVSHERDGEDGVVAWAFTVDCEQAPDCIPSKNYHFRHIFHQVRDPLKTIASAGNEPLASWKFICRYVPEIKLTDPPIIRGAKYWYYWNLLAEQKAEWTYRIEEIENLFDEFCSRLEIVGDFDCLKLLPKNVNTRGYKEEYRWSDLKKALDPQLYANVVSLALHYGYEVEDDD